LIFIDAGKLKTIIRYSKIGEFFLGQYELASSPKTCKLTLNVTIGDQIEKFLCFVPQDKTGDQAKHNCEVNGMRLYEAKSSPESFGALPNLARIKLGSSSHAEVYVAGRKATQCATFKGNGRMGYVPCRFYSFSVCEYFEVKVEIKCESYHKNWNSDPLIDVAGITSPQTCFYGSAIDIANTFLSVTTTVAKESIIGLDMATNAGVKFLPSKLAENFPNLQKIDCSSCSISSIPKKNFEGLSKLKYLSLNVVSYPSLDFAIFSPLPSLKTINMSMFWWLVVEFQ
jgi:hypothetical protein